MNGDDKNIEKVTTEIKRSSTIKRTVNIFNLRNNPIRVDSNNRVGSTGNNGGMQGGNPSSTNRSGVSPFSNNSQNNSGAGGQATPQGDQDGANEEGQSSAGNTSQNNSDSGNNGAKQKAQNGANGQGQSSPNNATQNNSNGGGLAPQGTKKGDPNLKAGDASKNVPKSSPQGPKPADSSKPGKSKNPLSKFFGKGKDKKGLVISKKFKLIAIGVSIAAFAIVIIVAMVIGGGESGNVASNSTYNTYYQNLDNDDPEYIDMFFSGDDEIQKRQGKLVEQVSRIYRNYMNAITHPGVAKYLEIKPEGYVELPSKANYEEFEATKLHVIATMFVEYSPDDFSQNINDDESVYNDTSAYDLCVGPEDCSNFIPEDDYTPDGLSNNIFNKVKSAAYYLKEVDDVRKLVRNTIDYKNICVLQNCSGKTQINPLKPFNKECIGTVTEEEQIEYETMSFFKFILKKYTSFQTFGISSIFERNFWHCKAHLKGLEGGVASLTASLFYGIKDTKGENWDIANYELVEDVNICSYYEWLMEDNYLDNKYRIKEQLGTTVTDNYAEEFTKFKLQYVKDIITAVDLANTSDPITVEDAAKLDLYTVSTDVLIRVNDTATGNSVGLYPIDLYVQGVLSREVGGFYGRRKTLGVSTDQVKEGWKAMAIAIRSYALARTNGGMSPIGNTAAAQVFSPEVLVDPNKANQEYALIMRAAALETSGLILRMDNKFFSAEYDSYNKDDYYCDEEYCYSNYKIKGNDVEKTHYVKIPSSWIGMANGGHGRGMSQIGVYYLASEGWTYKQMLDYFYGNKVNLYYMDYANVKETGVADLKNYTNINLGGSSEFAGEAILSCDYGIEIPLRTTGITNFDIYGFAGLECKSVGQVVRGGICTEANVNDTPSNRNQFIINEINGVGKGIDNSYLAYMTLYDDKNEVNNITSDDETKAEPYEIFGTWDDVYTGNKFIDNARSFVGKKAGELSYYFNTNEAWSASFVTLIAKVTADSTLDFRSNSVRSWIYNFEDMNTFYHSDYWASSINNPKYYNAYNDINSVGITAGDIVFFFDNKCEYLGNGLQNEMEYLRCYKHMGIVTYVTNDTITYVHGNSSSCGSNGVCETTINRNDPYIIGYGKY